MSNLLYKSFNFSLKCFSNKKFSQFIKNNSSIASFVISSKFSSNTSKNYDQSKIVNEKKKIEATKYETPPSDIVDDEQFYEKFWTKYEKKMKDEIDLYKDYPDRIRYKKHYDNPVERTFGILKDDILEFFGKLKHNSLVRIRDNDEKSTYIKREENFPSYCDIVIIGGGIVGTSIAFHLQERAKNGLRVVVIEKDMSYSKASTVLSVGGIRQQFSTPENIILSRYGMDFLQQAKKRLLVDEDDPPRVDVNFNGYLTLASEEGYPQLLQNYELQKLHNAHVEMFTKEKLRKKFPWLNVDNIEAGTYGVQREGWFDPWSFLLALNRKSKEMGAEFVNGTATKCNLKSLGDHIMFKKQKASLYQVDSVEVTLENGETRDIKCAICVIAAGAWSKEVGLMCGIGTGGTGTMNAIPIPVEPRKRFVYCVKSPNGPGLNTPLVINPDGSYFRREGLADLYLCGQSPTVEEEPSIEDLSVDETFFQERVWPAIAERCQSFENLKLYNSWAGYYDYNTLDQNAIIGLHPLYSNLLVATGFSGHGIQQAAGAGKAISELIIDAELKTLDIGRFGFERVIMNEPILEKCVY